MELKSNISHSFDTSLGSLIQHVEGQLAEIRSISDDSSCQIERLPHIDLEIYLEQLRKQLEYDNLVNEHTINTIENLKTLFSQTMNESNLNEISDELLYLARKVRPLDLEMMFDLFVKAKQCAEQISNKDVILLLGGTGVGKSTTIQFLGGSEMVREEMCGVPHIAVKRLKYEVLSTFITSPLMSSETKTINAAEVSLEECGASTTGWITLCDTPGFGDTAGAEVDIANSIGIAHAMRLCRSIKPLIVIGYRSIGERLEGLMKLSDLLVKLFGSIELNLPSFTYIFTKFPKDDVFYISNQITLKLRALNSNDKANKAFVALINDIIKKTKNGAFILDPVIDDPGKYLDHLISVPSMERTFADINNFVTTESLHTLLSQLQLHSSSISHALNRMDMDVVSYKLQQVVHVKEALKISDCNGIVDECLSNVIHWGNSLLDTFTNHLKHIFDDETMDTEEDIKHMCNVYLALIKFDMLRSSMMEYLGCTSATEKYASLQLLKHVFDLHTRFIGSFKNSTFIHSNSNTSSSPSAITSLSTSLKNSYTFNRTVAMLNKLSIIYEEFISISNMTNKEFLEIYFSNCWKHTKSEWNLACEIAVIDAKNINIASFFNHINFIKSIEESCNQFLSVEDDNGNNNVDSNNGNNDLLFTSDELMDLFIENVHKNHDTVQIFNGMSGSRIIYENLDEINHMVRVLQQAQECFISNDFNNIYNGEYNNILNSFMSHLNIFSNEITNLRLSITGHIHLFPILQTLKCISAFSAMINIHCNHIIRSILVDIIIKELNEVRTLIQDKTIEEIDEYEIHSSKTSNSTSSVEVDAEENKEETMNEEKKSDSNGNGNGMKSFKSSIYDCINYDGNTNNATVSYTTSHSIGNLLDDINQAVVTAIDLFSQRTSQSLLNTWNIICGCNGNNQDATTTADTLRDIFHTTSRYLHLLSTLEHIYCNEASFPVRNAPLYEELFHIIPHRLLSEWCAADNGKLVHIQRQLLADKEEAVNTSDMKRLCELMNQIQYLVLLDPFLPKTCTPNFMMLQDMIVTAIRGCMSSLCTRIRGSIASHNWDDVAVFLKKFDANYSDSINDFNELCSCICTELEGMWTGLSDNIKNMNSQSHTQCLSRETFLSMHSLLGSMYDAATHVFIFLTPEQTNVLSENISNIKQRLQSVVIRRLITAIDHITLPKEDFEKAVECIPQILSVADTFKNMSISANLIAKYPQFSYNQSNFDDFIRYQCNALVEDIRTKIRMIISSYEKTDKPLVTIIQQGQPKLFLNSLKSMSKMNSQFQQDITALLAVLKKTVEGMTKNVLEQKGNEVSISISHGEHVVRDLEMLFPYLPDEIQGDVGASIRACEILINEAKQKEEEECRFLDQSGEFHKLIELYLKSIENRDYYKIDKYRTDVQKTIRAENIKIKDFLNKNKIENALKIFADKYDNWFYYINNLKSILHKVNNSKRIYTWTILSPWNYYQAVEKLKPDIDMEQLCLETERNMRTYTCNVLDHMNKLSITDCQAINKLDYRFNDFIAISNIFENSEPFRSFLTSKCNNVHPLQCIKIISQIFTCYKTHVEKALCSGDATILATILSTIKDLDNTVAEAKRYESSYHTCLHCPDLHTALENFPTFDGIRCDFSKVILHLKDELLTKFDQNPRAKSKNAYDRDEFYKYYSNSFKKLLSMRPIAIYYSSEIINMNTLEDNFRRHIYDQFVSIEETLEVAMKLFPFDNNNDQVARDICIYIDNFRSIEENFDDDRIQNEATARRVKCINAFQQAIQKYYNSVLCAHMDDNNSIVTNLINLKKVGINISIFKTTIDDTIDTFLQEIKRIKGMKTIGLIGVSLNNQISNKTTAQMLINETRALQGYSIALRNEKTLRMTYKDILKDIECDHDSSSTLDRNVLECHYKAFDEEYWRLVELGINDIKTVQDIPNKMYSNLSSLRTTQERCLHILIYVFSYWTLENYRSRRLDKDSEKLKSIGSNNSTITTSTTTTIRDQFDLLRPHAAQVLACFLLLGIEHHDSNTTTNTMSSSLSSSWHLFPSPSPRNVFAFAASLKRQLVQILTGEGKSLILSVTAIVLAVMGCNVNCACYSHYLSQRDFEAYSHLFNAFSVKQFISYGTFHSLCESMINRNGNIRHMVRNVITNSTSTNNSDCPNGSRSSGSVNDVINSIMKTEVDLTRPNILLIDEVDVFFSSDFYGNLYKPVTTIQDPIITYIILYIWNNNSINNSRNLKTGIRFDDVRKTSEYAAIISKYSHWKDLIENSIRMMLFDLKTFDAHEYVVQDDMIGYKDQDNISFNISYGYKTMFAYLKECLEVKPPRISRATMNSKLSLSIGCGVFSYAEIPKEYDGLMGVTGTLKTLSTPEKDLLKTSYNTSRHAYIPSVYGKNQMIFAKDSPSDCLIESSASFYAAIEGIVRRAVTAGSITLLTRIFGRGTDFICYDDNLIQNGGVHVIQTFVSIQLSEETQIMGRTARQGNKGSFSLILLDEELEKFGIQNIDIDRMRATGSYYTAIDKARCEYFHKEYPENMRYVDTIKGDHENSLKFIHSLVTNDIHQISSYLVDKNQASIDTNETFRTVCLMDATGSMSQLLQKCKNTVQTMFERLETVLQAKNRKANIEMQYVMYRNYSSGTDKLLEFSSWESDPMNLRMFMDSIGVSGGQGNEAIEVALHHACVEDDNQKIHQIILIGDRPPNTDEEIIEKRSFCGEEYWSRTKFATPTNARSEVIKIRNKNIPVHAFYVKQYAQIFFEKISSATGGRCEELQIHSDRGSEQLIDLMSEEVLRTVGGKELVDEYQKMYKKGFTD
eukprot:gene2329-4529_t